MSKINQPTTYQEALDLLWQAAQERAQKMQESILAEAKFKIRESQVWFAKDLETKIGLREARSQNVQQSQQQQKTEPNQQVTQSQDNRSAPQSATYSSDSDNTFVPISCEIDKQGRTAKGQIWQRWKINKTDKIYYNLFCYPSSEKSQAMVDIVQQAVRDQLAIVIELTDDPKYKYTIDSLSLAEADKNVQSNPVSTYQGRDDDIPF